MAWGVQISVFGDRQLDRKLIGNGARAVEAQPLYDMLGHKLSGIWRETFQSSGVRGGSAWAPLADSTIRSKAAHGSSTPERPLEDTGMLRESGLYGDELNIFEATPAYLHWGSNAEWGQYHQPDPQGRRVFRLTEIDRVEIMKDFQYWIRYGKVRF
jgi:hypothetical protein